MSPNTLRLIITLVFLIHGVGHIMGIMPAVGLSTLETWNVQSWLLTGILGETLSRILAFILFLLPTLGFLGAALALMGWLVPHEWWRPLATWSAIISLVAIFLFWNAFVAFFPNKVGAIAVNVMVLVGLLWAKWPSDADIDFTALSS